MQTPPVYDITKDDLGRFGRGPALVTFGEVMVRDTPADMERPERTRLVHLSMAGSEYTLAIGLARLGIPSAYITRVPDNPYGRAVRNIARENGVNTDHMVQSRFIGNSKPGSSPSPSGIPTRLSSIAGSRRPCMPTAHSSARLPSNPSRCVTGWAAIPGMPVSTMGCSQKILPRTALSRGCWWAMPPHA